MMKTLLLSTLCLFTTTILVAQEKVQNLSPRVDSLSHKVQSVEQEIKILKEHIRQLNASISEVKEQNIRLKQALNYGKAITQYTSPSGIIYKLVSLVGIRAEGRVIATVQLVSPETKQNVSLYIGAASPYIIDLYGKRVEAIRYQIGEQNSTTLMANIPLNGTIVIEGLSPERQSELRLLFVPASEGMMKKVSVPFENLKVEWQ